MNCRKARQLIDAEFDTHLGSDEERMLREHLRECYGCNTYRLEVSRIIEGLERHSESVSQSIRISDEFDNRLHTLLLEENFKHSAEPINIIIGYFNSFHQRLQPVVAQMFRGVAIALLLILVLLGAPSLFRVYSSHSYYHPFGHIAAFNVRRGADGRIYASLTQQPGGCSTRGEVQEK